MQKKKKKFKINLVKFCGEFDNQMLKKTIHVINKKRKKKNKK